MPTGSSDGTVELERRLDDVEFLRAIGVEPCFLPDSRTFTRHDLQQRRKDLFIRAYAIFQVLAMVATLIWTLRN